MAKFYPPVGKKLVIIGQDNASIYAYTKAYGHAPAGVMFYTPLRNFESISVASDRGGGVQDLQGLIHMYPNVAIQVGLHLGKALDDIANGGYDHDIDDLACFFEKLRRPIYLRAGYEFDIQRYNPQTYVGAYERIASRMQEKTSWVSMVWHASCTPTPESRTLSRWFPSASLVDWIGISYFPLKHFCTDQFNQIAELADRHEKMLMIAESTVWGGINATSWNDWFIPYFDFIEKHNVAIVCYISWNWESFNKFKGKGWGNAEIHTSPFFENWKQELGKEKYIVRS